MDVVWNQNKSNSIHHHEDENGKERKDLGMEMNGIPKKYAKKIRKKMKKSRNDRTIGWMVFIGDNCHIIDRLSRVLFPVMFFLVNLIFFLYHRLHPETVDS